MLLLEADGKTDALIGAVGQQTVFDYLATEVFRRADACVQKVLVSGAILPKMDARWVQALSGVDTAGQVLAELADKHYFTYQLTAQPPVYRYHPLVREFLLATASSRYSEDEIDTLKRNAARLLAEGGEFEHAVDVLQGIGAWDESAAMLLRHVETLMRQGRSHTVEEWLRRMPPESFSISPWLSFWLGICRLARVPAEARVVLERAYESFRAAGNREGMLRCWCAIVETFVYERARYQPLIPWIAEMERILGCDDAFSNETLEAGVSCAMFMALMYAQPQHPDMERWADRVERVVCVPGSSELCARVAPHLLMYQTWWRGDFSKAEYMLRALQRHVDRTDATPLKRIAWHLMSATFFVTWADDNDSLASVDRGLALAHETGVHVWDTSLCVFGVFGALIGRDVDRARQYLQRMGERLAPGCTLDTMWFYYLRSKRHYFHKELALARACAERALALAEEGGWVWVVPHLQIDLARVLHREGYTSQAHEWLRKVLVPPSGGYSSSTYAYMAHLTAAEFALYEGDERACIEALSAYLASAKNRRFQRHPWWHPRAMAQLYARALAHGIETHRKTSRSPMRGHSL
jgi:LuxR family maltose regulon positive regulatory protein